MIAEEKKNKVYMSALLRYNSEFNPAASRIEDLFKRHAVEYDYLSDTNDIWCRDYMPIQVTDEKYVQFTYQPAYLKGFEHLITKPNAERFQIKGTCVHSNIILDGGNIVSCGSRTIISNRIFDENPQYRSKLKLVSELEDLLESEVIIFPQIKSDFTGHADGYVRWINEGTILINQLDKEYKYWAAAAKKVMASHALEYVEVPFFEYKSNKAPLNSIGCYLNYLELFGIVVLPIFNLNDKLDSEVLHLISTVFPLKKVLPVNINEIANHGGLLNCITWTVSSGSVT